MSHRRAITEALELIFRGIDRLKAVSYTHLDVYKRQFLDWVQTDNVLAPGSVIVEWLGRNPFSHTDSNLAPEGHYMFTAVDQWVQLIHRSAA